MQPLSAAEAISPALNRTRDFLFRPFRWATYLKLCAVAVLTEGLSGNFGNSNHGGASSGSSMHGFPNINPGMIAGLIIAGILFLILCVVLLYVVVRLRFALFHCLVHRTRELTPGWQIYREQSMRFFLLSVAVGVGILAVAAVALAPFVPGVLHLIRESQTAGRVNAWDLVPLMLQLAPVVTLLALACVAVDVVLRDFMLPHMALENATAGEAWAAALERFASQKGSFFLYAILRVILPFAAMMGLTVVLILPLLIVFGIPGVMIGLLHAAQAGSTGAAWLMMVMLQVVLGIFIAAAGVLLAICLGGPVSIAIRNYALVFYGGRYQLLGDLLAPPPPQTVPAASPLPA